MLYLHLLKKTSSYLTELPDADPHVRWCVRGGAAWPAPYPNLVFS